MSHTPLLGSQAKSSGQTTMTNFLLFLDHQRVTVTFASRSISASCRSLHAPPSALPSPPWGGTSHSLTTSAPESTIWSGSAHPRQMFCRCESFCALWLANSKLVAFHLVARNYIRESVQANLSVLVFTVCGCVSTCTCKLNTNTLCSILILQVMDSWTK